MAVIDLDVIGSSGPVVRTSGFIVLGVTVVTCLVGVWISQSVVAAVVVTVVAGGVCCCAAVELFTGGISGPVATGLKVVGGGVVGLDRSKTAFQG